MGWFEDLIKGAGTAISNIGSGLVDNAGSAALGGAGLLAANRAYERLGDIGEQALLGKTVGGQKIPGALDIAQMGLEQSAFRPFTIRSATGSEFGVTPTEGGGLAAAFGLSPEEAAFQSNLFGGAGRMYSQAMAPTGEREADLYERIRGIQSPEEERQRLLLEERLANQGRLGVRSNLFGGTPEQLALSQAQEEARNKAALMAIDQAQREQLQQAQLGQQFLASSYLPQAQMLNVQQGAQLYPQLAQRGQLYGAGLFGEASSTGLNALLSSALGQANLIGTIGAGLLSGAVR